MNNHSHGQQGPATFLGFHYDDLCFRVAPILMVWIRGPSGRKACCLGKHSWTIQRTHNLLQEKRLRNITSKGFCQEIKIFMAFFRRETPASLHMQDSAPRRSKTRRVEAPGEVGITSIDMHPFPPNFNPIKLL